MTLRRRLTSAAALAVGLAVTLACAVAWITIGLQLRSEVDRQLRLQARGIGRLEASRAGLPNISDLTRGAVPQLGPQEGGPVPYVQALDSRGAVRRQGGQPARTYRLPIDDLDRRIARRGGTMMRDVHDGSVHLRLLTVGTQRGAIQLARPLNTIDRVLRRTLWVLLAIVVAGTALAAVLGRLVTRRVTRPLRDVAQAAEHIAATDNLRTRLSVASNDEVGQLAARFNTMLDRLETSRGELAASVASQRQLVADASHELRTPITSLRTNIELLLEGGQRDPHALLEEVDDQFVELSALVGDIIDLARGEEDVAMVEDVRLDQIVEAAADRGRRHYPDVVWSVRTRPVTVDGDRERLARAVANLLDNAGKHSQPGQHVEVDLRDDGLVVRDEGPGIAEADLPHIFDRFYRGAAARGAHGSGLGLAIVQQTARAHGGEVTGRNRPGGGAEFRLTLTSRVRETADA